MKLRTKLILSFSVVILLVGGIGITSSYINEAVKNQVTTESKEAIEEIELAGEMGLQLYRSLTKTQYLLEDKYRQSLSSDFSKGSMSNKIVIKNIDQSLQKFRQSLQKTKRYVNKHHSTLFRDTSDTQQTISLLNKLEKKFGIYSSLVTQLQKLSSTSYADGKEFFTVTIEPYFRTNLLPLIEKVRKEIQVNHEQKVASFNSNLAWVSRILGIATILALLVAISITFFLYRSIANPINKLAEAAQNIAQGNLDDRIDYDSNDELGQLSQTFNNMAESLSRTTVSRDYVDSIIESMADLLVVTDEEYRITRINSAGLQMLDRQEEALLNSQVHSLFKDGRESSLFQNSTEATNVQIQDEKLLARDGKVLPVNVSKGTLHNRQGNIEGYVIVASDISSEKEAQEKIRKSLKEKEILLAEIHHRVKNNLAVISGLLQMQIWEADNDHAAAALQESQLRVRSIALVHEKLYQSENLSYIEFDKYVQDLLQAIQSTYVNDRSNIQIQTELEGIVLNINQAISCSLLLNELMVNAFKHAFDDGEDGTVMVSMSKTDGEVTMCVKDNGQGFPKEENSSESLGMSLINTLSKQLQGDLELRNNNGAEVIVKFEAEDNEY